MRGPIRSEIGPPSGSSTIIVALKGRRSTPALSGEYPSSSCVYSGRKKSTAARTKFAARRAMFPPVKLRLRKKPKSTSGLRETRSTRAKTTSSTAAAMNRTIDVSEAKPHSCPWFRTRESAVSPPASVPRPGPVHVPVGVRVLGLSRRDDRQNEEDHAEGHVDPEDRAPFPVGQDAAECRADAAHERACGGPDPDRRPPL